MGRFIAFRTLYTLVVMWGAATVVFFALQNYTWGIRRTLS